MNYQAILFDMDGIIVESETAALQSIAQKLCTHGIPCTPKDVSFTVGLNIAHMTDRIIEKFHMDMDREQVLALLDPEDFFQGIINGTMPAPLIEGFSELEQHFAGQLKYAIASGSPLAVIESHVKRYNLKNFSALLSSDGMERGKPHPDIFLAAAQALDVPIQRCIVIEDSPHGVLAGKSAGAHTIAVPTQHTRNFDFSSADKLCSSLLEARDYIKTLL